MRARACRQQHAEAVVVLDEQLELTHGDTEFTVTALRTGTGRATTSNRPCGAREEGEARVVDRSKPAHVVLDLLEVVVDRGRTVCLVTCSLHEEVELVLSPGDGRSGGHPRRGRSR
jgi:hypothetical protein